MWAQVHVCVCVVYINAYLYEYEGQGVFQDHSEFSLKGLLGWHVLFPLCHLPSPPKLIIDTILLNLYNIHVLFQVSKDRKAFIN